MWHCAPVTLNEKWKFLYHRLTLFYPQCLMCSVTNSKADSCACLGAGAWTTNSSLIRKLRLRYSYLSAGGNATSTRPSCRRPLQDVPPLNDDDERLPSSEAQLAVVRRLPASSPSSPVPTRHASSSPRPRRMCSMLVAGRDGDPADHVDWASDRELLCSVSGREVTQSTSLGTLVVEAGGRLNDGGARRPATTTGGTMNSLLRHTGDLVATSGVRPGLLADFLRRRDVVSDETVAAIGRCVARRAACELLAEVVASKAEVTDLCDALRATGCADAADCLAAVQSLLHLTDLSLLQSSGSVSESSASAHVSDRLLE